MSDLKDKITQDQHAGQLRRMNSVFYREQLPRDPVGNTAKHSVTSIRRYSLSDYVFGAQATMIVQRKIPQARCVSHFQLVSVPCVEQSYVLRGRSHAG